MTRIRLVLVPALLAACAGPLAAQDSGGFVVKLGRDTTSFETYTRTATRIEAKAVGRAPRVLVRDQVYELGPDGGVKSYSIVVRAPGAAPDAAPIQRIEGRFTGDSVITHVHGGAGVRTLRVAIPAGATAIYLGSPWVMYEDALRRFVKSGRDSLRLDCYLVGATGPGWLRLRRLDRDSVAVVNDHDDALHARVDAEGRLLGVLPVSGTGLFTATRVANLDVGAAAAAWAAAEQASGAMGALSVRDTVTATAGGASLWIDYGRPAKRGRVVFGGVVPLGQLWRTGANAATQFRTDRALVVGGEPLPAGTYTLWTIPSARGWKLVVNSETGQWGTSHRPERDLFTVDMRVTTLPAVVERFTISVEPDATGGTLHLDWDTTRASVAFRAAAD